MAGGFLIKFDGIEVERCFSCRFDYDDWSYSVNDSDRKEIPESIKKIEVEVETDIA